MSCKKLDGLIYEQYSLCTRKHGSDLKPVWARTRATTTTSTTVRYAKPLARSTTRWDSRREQLLPRTPPPPRACTAIYTVTKVYVALSAVRPPSMHRLHATDRHQMTGGDGAYRHNRTREFFRTKNVQNLQSRFISRE